MEPIANETWKSFRRSYYRARLLLLLSSLGEAYLGQLSRMLRIPPKRVAALLYGDPERGYCKELALIELGLAREKATFRGRAFEITDKGRRKARSIAAARSPREPRERSVREATTGVGGRWTVDLHDRAGGLSSVSWNFDG